MGTTTTLTPEQQEENCARLAMLMEQAKNNEMEIYGRELTPKELVVVAMAQVGTLHKSLTALWAHMGAEV